MISKARSYLLDSFLNGDMEEVGKIRNYLVYTLEDENYFALSFQENWLFLYWAGEYEKLLQEVGSFRLENCMADTYNKIYPYEDILLTKVLEKSRNGKGRLEKLLSEDNSSVDALNERVDKFIETYPQSPYIEYVRHNNIRLNISLAI